jgi:hypothetical protein
VAALDVAAALAEVAAEHGWVRPQLAEGGALAISGGRHPVLEARLPAGACVPNDCTLGDGADIVLVSGPNMGGKSTYLRQTALIVLLAQCGSFVPAERARIPLVDRICTRVGAQDDIAAGQSTFMVEMIETAAILHTATERSLVLLDEVGRGTATADGLAIARAVVEHLHHRPGGTPRTLFATHFQELCALAGVLPRVANASVAVVEEAGGVVFLHRIVPGAADRAYGVHVAALAGLPGAVVARARELLLAAETAARAPASLDAASAPRQPALGMAPPAEPLLTELAALEPDALTPLGRAAAVVRVAQRGPTGAGSRGMTAASGGQARSQLTEVVRGRTLRRRTVPHATGAGQGGGGQRHRERASDIEQAACAAWERAGAVAQQGDQQRRRERGVAGQEQGSGAGGERRGEGGARGTGIRLITNAQPAALAAGRAGDGREQPQRGRVETHLGTAIAEAGRSGVIDTAVAAQRAGAGHRKHPRVGRRELHAGGALVPDGRDHQRAVTVDGFGNGLTQHARVGGATEGHHDDAGASAGGVEDAGCSVGDATGSGTIQHLHRQHARVPGDAAPARGIVAGRGRDAGHERAMPFIVDGAGARGGVCVAAGRVGRGGRRETSSHGGRRCSRCRPRRGRQ